MAIHRLFTRASTARATWIAVAMVLALLNSGCVYKQALLGQSVSLSEFRQMVLAQYPEHLDTVRREACVEASWHFHRGAAQNNRCESDGDCVLFHGLESYGPGWVAVSRAWSEVTSLRARVHELCGYVDRYDDKPDVRCIRNECVFKGVPPNPSVWQPEEFSKLR